MVPTVVERDGTIDAVQMSRRAALGTALLAVAGCHSKPKATPTPPVQVPDASALQTARVAEQALLASYDATITSLPLHRRAPLQVERAIHSTHLEALDGSPATQSTSPRTMSSLVTALRTSAHQLRRLALDASDGQNAALLASIAASHTASAR
jgi:hypothetical protein